MKFIKYPSNYITPPPATNEEIIACESRFNIKLPAELITLLKVQNGGDLDTESSNEPLFENLLGVSLKNEPNLPNWEPQIASLQDWLIAKGVLSDSDDTYPALEDHLGDLRKLISIGGNGIYHYLLDYRTESVEPNVYYLDLVGGDQELVFVANNFEALFQK